MEKPTERDLLKRIRELEQAEFELTITNRALKENEHRFRQALEDSEMLVCCFLADGEITFVNKAFCEFFDKKAAELVGKKFFNRISWADRKTVTQIIRSLTADSPAHSHEYQVIAPDDGIRWQLWTLRAMFDRKGNVRSYHAIGEDITDLKTAEFELYTTDRRLETSDRQLESAKKQLLEANRQLSEVNRQFKKTRQNLEYKSRLSEIFLTVPDDRIYYEVLKVILEATGSMYGVIGCTGEQGEPVSPAMNYHIWDKRLFSPDRPVLPENLRMDKTWFQAFAEKKPNFTNKAATDMPKDHVPVQRHASVPVIFQDNVIAVFQVANRKDEYTIEDIKLLEEIAAVLAPILNARLEQEKTDEERKKAAMESARLIQAIEQVADIIIITDKDGRIQYVNPAFETTTGYTRKEVLGSNLRLLKSGEHDDEFYQSMWAVLQKGETWKGRIINKRKDGTLFTENAVISPVCNAYGEVVNYVASKQDITRELKLEEQYRQAQKMESIGRLAGGVAHDYNNILSGIIGFTDLAKLKLAPSDPVHSYLDEVLNAAKRAGQLTRQLLAFARKQTISPRVLDLNNSLENMRKMLTRLIGEDIKLSWVPGPDLWPVKIDASQLDQILANLCVNARDAISGIGQVTIETANIVFEKNYCADHAGFTPREFVMLAVSDTGCGMDKEIQEHLFEPFYTTKEAGKGTGLGMATVYGIVRQNNGFINVYSEPGKGTVVKIYLPRHQGRVEETRTRKKEHIVPGKGETVLLVDDDPMVLQAAEQLLLELGYTVLPADSPEKARQIARTYKGDIRLLLTDVIMPEMNGRELSRQIQSIFPAIRILFMSGYTEDTISHHGVLEDGMRFIPKPFSKRILAKNVRKVLDE